MLKDKFNQLTCKKNGMDHIKVTHTADLFKPDEAITDAKKYYASSLDASSSPATSLPSGSTAVL